jgi:hypothetical protein
MSSEREAAWAAILPLARRSRSRPARRLPFAPPRNSKRPSDLHASRSGTGIANPALAGSGPDGECNIRRLFLFLIQSLLLLSCGAEKAGVMFDYDITTMRLESASLFFRRLTYALFIGWVVFGVYLFFVGDWLLSVNLIMVFIAFAVSFIVYRTLEIITGKR